MELPWSPFVDIKECDENKQNCKVDGLNVEMLEIISKMFNFTFTIDMEPDGNWATVPITGSYYDANATFGVMLIANLCNKLSYLSFNFTGSNGQSDPWGV